MKKRAPARIACGFGVHVRGTPLWIDAARRRELCVVTSIGNRLPPAHRRLVATPELALLLTSAGHKSKVLATPRDRWVGVGGERLQLVDAGAGVVSAAALIALADETVLVTGPLCAAAVDWPRADHIVARVPALQHRGESLATVTAAIAALGVRCSVRVESLDVAFALAGQLAKHVTVRGVGLVAELAHLGVPMTGRGATVELGLTRLAHGSGHRVDVDSGLGLCRGANLTLALRWFADRAVVEALVASASPKRLTLIGPHSRALAVATEVAWQPEPRQLSLGNTQRVEN